jgi:hypothetical protein
MLREEGGEGEAGSAIFLGQRLAFVEDVGYLCSSNNPLAAGGLIVGRRDKG